MRLIYEDVDITQRVGISYAAILDNAGGKLDGVEVVFEDTQGLWSGWQPREDDRLRLDQDGFDSGVCYVGELGQRRGQYVLMARSVPSGASALRSRSWERVTLLQLVSDAARTLGYSVDVHQAGNPTYARVDQMAETDLKFLADRCALEGCALKVSNHRLIVYDEAALERAAPVRRIEPQDFLGPMEYRKELQDTYARCVVSYGAVSGAFAAPGRTGQTLTVTDRYVTNIGEAQRFARGLLRQQNRMEHQVEGVVALDLRLAGGGMVGLAGVGSADGRYMVDRVEHRLTEGRSPLHLRRKLEGY